jgi:hypothetical protein
VIIEWEKEGRKLERENERTYGERKMRGNESETRVEKEN